MILPIRTNIRPQRTPYANYALIAINAVIFILTYGPHRDTYLQGQTEPLRHWAEQYMLWPDQKVWFQYISYAFLHANWVHIVGNMFFLYLFGNNVCDKLGTIKYLLLYFAGAVFAAAGQVWLTSMASPDNPVAPLLGASGAVAAVTGAFFVLFPQSYITVIYWFFIIGTFEVPAFYFILLKLIILDNLIDTYTSNIAYEAHLAGYAFGITAALIFLVTGLVSSSGFDLLAMIKQWNRRRKFRDIVSTGYDPFSGSAVRKKINSKETSSSAAANPKIMQLRSQINSRIAEKDLHDASRLYLDLMEMDKEQLFPQGQMLDIANQLASEGRHEAAAATYEQFIKHYKSYEHIGQVQLMLGLIYSRYLDKPQDAARILQQAQNNLTDPAQLQMCKDEIEKLKHLM